MHKKYKVLLVFLIIILVRILFVINWKYFLDADESVVGIMAKHIMEGKSAPIFYYGQAYMGTLEQYTTALFFKISSISPLVLKTVPLFYFILTIVFLYRIVEKYCKKNGLYLLLFFIFPSLFSIIWSLKARGGFIEVIFLSVLFITCLLEYRSRGKILFFYLASLIAGFSIYINTLSLPFLVVSSYIFLLDSGKVESCKKFALKDALISLSLFVLGIFPIIYYNLTHHGDYQVRFLLLFDLLEQRLSLVFFKIMPFVFGSIFDTNGNLIYHLLELSFVILTVIAIVIVFYKYRKQIVSLFKFKRDNYNPVLYFIIPLLFYLLALTFSSYLFDIGSARYLAYCIVFIPLIFFEFFNILLVESKKLAKAFIIVIVLIGFLNSTQFLIFKESNNHTTAYNMLIEKNDYTNLINFLIKNDYKTGFADYWIQWDLNFLSKEELQFSVSERSLYDIDRYSPYSKKAIESKNPVYIFKESDILDKGYIDNYTGKKHDYVIIDKFIVFYPTKN